MHAHSDDFSRDSCSDSAVRTGYHCNLCNQSQFQVPRNALPGEATVGSRRWQIGSGPRRCNLAEIFIESTMALLAKLSYTAPAELQERNRWQKMCWA
jgi:hypothetical protein